MQIYFLDRTSLHTSLLTSLENLKKSNNNNNNNNNTTATTQAGGATGRPVVRALDSWWERDNWCLLLEKV
jgi:hypothetical protein